MKVSTFVQTLPEGATYGDALAIVRFKAALEGKADAAREIREAIEGKTGQRQDDTGPDQFPVSIVFPGELPPWAE